MSIHFHQLESSQQVKNFSDKIRYNIKEGDILIFDLYNEICQHLEDFHNSVNKYFSHNQCMMLQNNAQENDEIKMQERWWTLGNNVHIVH